MFKEKEKRVYTSLPADIDKELRKAARDSGQTLSNYLFGLILKELQRRKKIGAVLEGD